MVVDERKIFMSLWIQVLEIKKKRVWWWKLTMFPHFIDKGVSKKIS